MDDEAKKGAAFTLEEIRIFTILAIALAVIATAIGFVAHSEISQLLAIALATVMMAVVPLVVYLLRRGKHGK